MREIVEKNAEVLSNEVIDMVNSPPHHKLNGLDIESVDVIRAVLTAEEFRGWCKGNAIKYLMRLGKKDKEIQDARKSIKFLEWLVKELEE